MNRLDAIDLARAHALAHGQTGDHAYLPSTDAEAAEWLPHAWVVDAIVSAATERERATDDTGFQARYRLPGGKWSSWGHVVCGVKGHEMELREVSGDAADFAWTVEDQAAVDADTGCAWTQDNDEGSDTWATACGRLFCVTEGTPAENNMRFCCYCGKALQEHALLPEADDAA